MTDYYPSDEDAAQAIREFVHEHTLGSELMEYAFGRAINLLELQHEANIWTDKILAKKYPHLYTSDDDPTLEEWELIKEDLRTVRETGFFPDRTQAGEDLWSE